MRGKPKAEGGRRGNVLAGSWFLLHPSSFILLPFSFAARSLLQPHPRHRARRARERGLQPDGRLLALNSYENRVYQVWLEDAAGRRSVVASSTARRAGATRRSWRSTPSPSSSPSARSRWSRRSPLRGAPRCMRSAASASPSIRAAAAARPSWRTRDAGVDGALHRPHPRRGRDQAVRASGPRSTSRAFGASRATGCSRAASFPPICSRPGRARSALALAGVARCYERAGDVRTHAPARRLPRRQRAVDRRGPALRRLRRLPHGPGGAGPVDAALGRPRLDDAAARGRARRLRGLPASSIRASCTCSRRCARCASSTTRRGSRGAGTIPRFPPRFPGSTRSATGRTASWSCASRSR